MAVAILAVCQGGPDELAGGRPQTPHLKKPGKLGP
jgi:hypothetical protein